MFIVIKIKDGIHALLYRFINRLGEHIGKLLVKWFYYCNKYKQLFKIWMLSGFALQKMIE